MSLLGIAKLQKALDNGLNELNSSKKRIHELLTDNENLEIKFETQRTVFKKFVHFDKSYEEDYSTFKLSCKEKYGPDFFLKL